MRFRRANARMGMLLGVLLALTGSVVIISWFAMRSAKMPHPAEADELAEQRAALASIVLPEFSLVDQDGVAHSREMFKGQRTILAFTFTHCPTACPIMNSHLIRLQGDLRGTPVRTVSITVDPEHDTPSVLRAHAERLSIDTGRWMFLTGAREEIERIIASLKFGVQTDPSTPVPLPGGGSMANIIHPTKLLLIGPDLAVEALEDGLTWDGVQRLGRRARSGVRR
jgi:protein SCO1/2